MSDVVQSVFGGGNSNQQQSSQSGFALLPQEIQDAFKSFATTAGSTLNPGGTPNASLYTLPALNSGSTSAMNSLENGNYAITPENFDANMKMLQNPYDSSVINQINKAATGDSSQLTSEMSKAGDFGGNRSMLGASDISNNAADLIGSFLTNEYNQNKSDALAIPGYNMGVAGNAVNAGLTQQGQQMQNQQAPVSALSQLAALYGILPSTGGSTSQGTGSSQQNNGIFKSIGI